MVCSHCEIAIQDAVRKLPGIIKAKASRRKKLLTVDYDGEAVSQSAIIDAVKQTGYGISEL